jgi:predicted PurR-regulated permease PerM
MASPRGNAALYALVAALAALFAAMVWPFLLSIFMGVVLAVLVDPAHGRLARRTGPKLAALLLTLGLFVAVAAPLALFGTVTVREAQRLFDTLSGNDWQAWLASLDPRLLDFAREAAAHVSRGLLAGAKATPELLLKFLFGLGTCYFTLLDGRRLLAWALDRTPLSPETRRELVRSFQNSAVSVIWATVAVAAAQAAVICAAFLVLGVPGVFLATGATFILAWIPLVHSTPVSAAAMVYLYLQGDWGRLGAMAAFAAFAGIIDNVVRPWILKGRDDIHPLIALLSIFGGIELFGLVGVFVGPIVAAVLVALLRALP